MPKVAVYDMEGKQVGEMNLKEEIFGIEPNEAVMHQAVLTLLASWRRGTHDTKKRGEVSGGGRKPWRQKGTGRARAGTIRSPLWRGGSIIFGPHPRDYSISINKKVRRLALKSALSVKAKAGEIVVLDNLVINEAKTKQMAGILNKLNVDNKALVVTRDADENIIKSARNIPGIMPVEATAINVYDILNHDKLIITKDAVAKVEEVFV